MLIYIKDLINKLRSRSLGIEQNAVSWENKTTQKAQVDIDIAVLELLDKQITDASKILQQKRELSRKLVDIIKKNLSQIDACALGIHKNDPEKLKLYGISVENTSVSNGIPQKDSILSIEDDIDEDGFVIKVQSMEKVEYFEIEKAIISVPVINSFDSLYPISDSFKKFIYSDGQTKKGIRYFYRIRGVNGKRRGSIANPPGKML